MEGNLCRHAQASPRQRRWKQAHAAHPSHHAQGQTPHDWQEVKGKGDDEIRSMAAQDFDALVPVMAEMGMGEQGLRKRSITYIGTQELAA